MSILYMNLVLVGFILLSFNLRMNSIQIILIKRYMNYYISDDDSLLIQHKWFRTT
jgi:hypothetical protein